MITTEEANLIRHGEAKAKTEQEIEEMQEGIAELQSEMDALKETLEEKSKAVDEAKRATAKAGKALDQAEKEISTRVRCSWYLLAAVGSDVES